jgi:hypothetical protein
VIELGRHCDPAGCQQRLRHSPHQRCATSNP